MLFEASERCTLYQSLIAASSGLLGVIVGGFIATWNQRNERKITYLIEELREFYAPLLGMCTQVLAKAGTSQEINRSRISERLEQLHQTRNPEAQSRISDRFREHDNRIEEDNKNQFDNEIFPAYRNMLNRFTSHMWLSEPSTLKFYSELVELVELLRLDKENVTEPGVAGERYKRQNELFKNLEEFNKDLRDNSEKLKKKLKGKRWYRL
jgi:hypothetical protein